jgi:hypothetical protein
MGLCLTDEIINSKSILRQRGKRGRVHAPPSQPLDRVRIRLSYLLKIAIKTVVASTLCPNGVG